MCPPLLGKFMDDEISERTKQTVLHLDGGILILARVAADTGDFLPHVFYAAGAFGNSLGLYMIFSAMLLRMLRVPCSP